MYAVKMTEQATKKYLKMQRHYLKKLQEEKQNSREPERVQSYIDFAKMAIKCAKRGLMLMD